MRVVRARITIEFRAVLEKDIRYIERMVEKIEGAKSSGADRSSIEIDTGLLAHLISMLLDRYGHTIDTVKVERVQ